MHNLEAHNWRGTHAALSDDALREAMQVESVPALLRKSRLRYVARLARDGAPKFLLSLLQNPGGSAATPWVTMMLDDLEALWSASPKLQSLGIPKFVPVVWLNFVKEWPRAWKVACRAFRCFKHRMPDQDDETQPVFAFPCPHCVKVFSSKKGVCTHLFRVRGEQRIVRNAVSSSQCFVCQTERGTHLRCMHHCQYSSRRCSQEILAGTVPALDPVIVLFLGERDLETRRIARALGISHLRRDVQEPS